MTHNFTNAEQTAQIFHPTAGCGTSQPVTMSYKGQRCSGSSSDRAGVLWQTAEPAAGSGLDASKCTLQRRTGTAAEDLIFNMEWFGSCGVPPARVQYIARSECPAAPPPPPPSPSPTPEDQKALERGKSISVLWLVSVSCVRVSTLCSCQCLVACVTFLCSRQCLVFVSVCCGLCQCVRTVLCRWWTGPHGDTYFAVEWCRAPCMHAILYAP